MGSVGTTFYAHMIINHRNIKETLLGLGVVLLSVMFFGAVIFFGSKRFESQDSSVREAEQQNATNEDVRASWDALMGRINNQDHAAVNELSVWSKTHRYEFIEYQTEEDSRYILFYRTHRFNQLPNALVIQGRDTLKAIDLGYDMVKAIGTTARGTFIFRGGVRGYTDDSSDGCRWDQSFVEVDATGEMISPIAYGNCHGERKIVFQLDDGQEIILDRVEASEMMLPTNALVFKTASGSLVELPLGYQGGLSEDVLTSFLVTGDRSSLFFPRNDQFLGQTTTTLYLRPTPHLDEESAAINTCNNQWGFSMADFRDGSKEQLAVIEKCMEVLNYPFKKLPIPGTSSYYGFMGNGSNIGEDYDRSPGGVAEKSVWCQIDGLPNGCMLYKVERGIPKLLVAPNQDRGAEGPSLTQLELLRANQDGSLLVHQFPYEIFYFQEYYTYDFVSATTTGRVVYYSAGSDWGEVYASSTLTFYPSNREVKFEIDDRPWGMDATTTLLHNGMPVLSFWETEEDVRHGRQFPLAEELRAYALQADKTKFYFSVGDQKYTLDLAPAVPRAIQR